MRDGDGVFETLERWSSKLFLMGGAIVVAYAVIEAVPAFTDSSYPIMRNVLTAGYVLAFLGLIGQYRALSETQKWLARVGAGAALLGAVGFSFNSLVSLGQLGGLVPREAPAWSNAFVPLAIIGMVIGYLAMGTASLRGDVHSRGLSLLLLVPGTVFVMLFVALFTIELGQWGFIFTGTEALAILGVGYLLRAESPSTG